MTTIPPKWTPVHLPDVPPPVGAYSPGVKAGPLFFVSGQTPRDPATGQVVGSTIEEQTRVTLANVAPPACRIRSTLADVVSVTVYLADENDWGRFNEVYKGIMPTPYPTRAAVGAALRGILVEIAVIAYVP